jgi:hypothetical protein
VQAEGGLKAHECPAKKCTQVTSGMNTGRPTVKKMINFQGKCNSCGKQGHNSTDCWALDENKHKHPNWITSTNWKTMEHANVATNNGGTNNKVKRPVNAHGPQCVDC